MPELSEKISLLRTQAHMTQADLAEQLNVSRQTVSKWELGTALPVLDKVVSLSRLFHVSTDYLLLNREFGDREMSLDRTVLRFLGYVRDIDVISKDLVGIMQDGVIDEQETPRIHEIVTELNAVSQMIEELRYCLLGQNSSL